MHLNGARLTFWRALGGLVNLVGLPGFVRETEYASREMATAVTVRRVALYTVVTVNDVAVYFNRLSGLIDGVALSRTGDYPAGETQSAQSDPVPSSRRGAVQH